MFIWVSVTRQTVYYEEGISYLKCARLEKISGQRCVCVPFEELSPALVERIQPTAILFSGFGGTFSSYPIASFYGMQQVMTQCNLPMLAICGSFQLISYFFDPDFDHFVQLKDTPIRPLKKEDLVLPRYTMHYGDTDLSSYYIADGYFAITPVKEDPIFAHMPSPFYMRCQHYCEMKSLPPHFMRLAESAHSPIEAIRHDTRPLYGVQFHPECYAEPFLDGEILLHNFFSLPKQLSKSE